MVGEAQRGVGGDSAADGDIGVLREIQEFARGELRVRGEVQEFKGAGNGPVAAFIDGMRQAGADIRLLDYSEHALTAGDDASAVAYVETEIDGSTVWGVGIATSITTASLQP